MTLKTIRAAVVLTLVFIGLTGFAFPISIWAISSVAFPFETHGSLIRDGSGKIRGSALIGQGFSKPEYFHPRPSAAGNGYDATKSGGTNLGPTSRKLIQGVSDDPSTKQTDESFVGIETLAKDYRLENDLPPNAAVPADAVTRSGSGLDPEISVGNAILQCRRVAKYRRTSLETVVSLVKKASRGRTLGILGEPRVNVLELNLALDALKLPDDDS
jgi:K+-transporting ATPase ATPase C chain